jgi:HPt (histidine-containing phosphotransfer) domain-containing protein
MLGAIAAVLIEQLPQDLAMARDALQSGDWVRLTRAAHNLKSSLGLFALPELIERARQIEQVPEVCTSATLAPLTAGVDQLVAVLQRRIAPTAD